MILHFLLMELQIIENYSLLINDKVSVDEVKQFIDQKQLLNDDQNILDTIRLIASIAFSNPKIKTFEDLQQLLSLSKFRN